MYGQRNIETLAMHLRAFMLSVVREPASNYFINVTLAYKSSRSFIKLILRPCVCLSDAFKFF